MTTLTQAASGIHPLPLPSALVQTGPTGASARKIEDIFKNSFIISPFNKDKANKLKEKLAILDPPLLPQEKMIKLNAYLSGSGPQNDAQLYEFSQLLFDLEDAIGDIPNLPTVTELWALLPMKYVIVPFSVARAEVLADMLPDMKPSPLSDEKMKDLLILLKSGILSESQTYFRGQVIAQRRIFNLRNLLIELRQGLRSQPQDTIDKAERNFPIALLEPQEINTLISLQYPSKVLIFNDANRETFYQAGSIVVQLGVTIAIGYFRTVIDPIGLVFGSPLMKSAQDQYIRNIKARQEVVILVEGVFECPRCHNRRISYSERQIRSADEATSIFLHCPECKFNWREN